MRNLIVNADDFGLHSDVNHAIINGHKQGCITSTSLMPTGIAMEEAAELARQVPLLSVGVHLTLVAEKPVLPPEQISSLVDEQGRFFPDHIAFIKRFVQGKIRLDELRAECDAQICKLEKAGVAISHLDSHQHLHVLPKIIDICLDLAREHQIYKMRLPAEEYFFTGGYPADLKRKIARCGLSFCATLARSKAAKRHIIMPKAFFGMLAGGHMEEKYFLAVLNVLKAESSEIMVHPGMHSVLLGQIYDWQYHWTDEFHAVTSPAVMHYIKENHINLISFKELLHE
ncbi:MAG: ChbG/HpnK family deacetylase [Selenomonadaceae bacterium]